MSAGSAHFIPTPAAQGKCSTVFPVVLEWLNKAKRRGHSLTQANAKEAGNKPKLSATLPTDMEFSLLQAKIDGPHTKANLRPFSPLGVILASHEKPFSSFRGEGAYFVGGFSVVLLI